MTLLDYSFGLGSTLFVVAFIVLWRASVRWRFEARRALWKNRILDDLVKGQTNTIIKLKTKIIEWRAFVQRLSDMGRLTNEGENEAARRLQGDESEYVNKVPDA